jgi:hypothetical protein
MTSFLSKNIWKIGKFCVSLLCKENKIMKNYRLSLKRAEMMSSGAYDGRFKEKVVVDKKKKVNKEFARNKYSFNLLKNQ